MVTPQPRQAKHAATPSLLHAAYSLGDLSSAADRVTLGAAVLVYFFLLRKSEYAWSPSKGQDHRVKVKHLTFLDTFERQTSKYKEIEFVQLCIPSSKTDKRGIGVNLRLKRSGAGFLCPVDAAYVLWLNAIKIGLGSEEPLCTMVTKGKKTPLKAADITKLLKSAAKLLGKDPRNYGSHSLRSGGATAMFKANLSKTAIKLFGRWSSDAFERYIQIADCDVEDMSSRMVGKRYLKQALVGNHQPIPVGLF